MAINPSDLAKWTWLQQQQEHDWKDPRTLAKAQALRVICEGDDERFAKLAQSCARDCIRYESDLERTGGEDLDSPENAWRRGVDDCDAKARMFVALCRAGGIFAELVPWWQTAIDGDWLKHVSANVKIAGALVPVELTLARARLGELPDQVPKEDATGKWLR